MDELWETSIDHTLSKNISSSESVITCEIAGNIVPLNLVSPLSIKEFLVHSYISCIIKVYIMEAYKNTIFRRQNIRLYEISTFFNSSLKLVYHTCIKYDGGM